MHFARQAVVVRVRDRNNKSKPAIIAPTMLVAANSIPRRISDARTAPKIPVSNVGRILHTQLRTPNRRRSVDAIRVTARYTTEMPSVTHKKAGVTVIVAVKVRKAVITPIIMLAITASPVHSVLHEQDEFDI